MIAIKNWADWILSLRIIFQNFKWVFRVFGVYGLLWMCGVYGGCGFYVSRWCESSGGVVGGQSLFLGIQSCRLLRSGIGLTGRSHIWDFFPACKILRLPIQPSICSNSVLSDCEDFVFIMWNIVDCELRPRMWWIIAVFWHLIAWNQRGFGVFICLVYVGFIVFSQEPLEKLIFSFSCLIWDWTTGSVD